MDINSLFNMFTGAIHIGTRLIHFAYHTTSSGTFAKGMVAGSSDHVSDSLGIYKEVLSALQGT
jgi:hypothetical protein